jgi:putative endonuclease
MGSDQAFRRREKIRLLGSRFGRESYSRPLLCSRITSGLGFARVQLSWGFYMFSGRVLSRRVFSGQTMRLTLGFLDCLADLTLPAVKIAEHSRIGRRGELAAYFYLRRLGYVMVARNFRSPRCRGEIDLIGWEDDTLCFVEVKTRTTLDVKPAEAAVDRHKRRQIAAVAREYLRRFPPSCQWRFDVVSVYYSESKASQPQIEVFRNSSLRA